MNHTRVVLVASSLLFSSACGGTDVEDVDSADEALSARRTIASTTGAMVLGASPDGNRVVYGTACDAGGPATAIALVDALSGRTTQLAKGAACAPGTVTFSPNGALVAFGDGMGQLRVHSIALKKTVSVSRAGVPTMGVMFSPDSSWFVVASLGAAGSTLDAWEASLTAPTTIDDGAMFNPFGPASQNIQFSPDGARLLYLGGLTSQLPVGDLAIWNHTTRTTQTLATGVPASFYVMSKAWDLVAYEAGMPTTPAGPSGPPLPPGPPGPPGPPAAGDLVVRSLKTNQTHTVESKVYAMPLAFAGDTLLYGATAGGPPVPGAILKAHDFSDAATVTVDTDVFLGVGPGMAVSVSPSGDRIAYTKSFDGERFAGALRVASGPRFATARTLTSAVVPVQAYGWLAGGKALAFLHDATSTMPGATMGTLSAWDAVDDEITTLGKDVTQIGLRFEEASTELLFVSSYDGGAAAGDLEVWSSATHTKRTLGARAAVMTVQRSADGDFAGFLTLRKGPANAPPSTKLVVSRVTGAKRTTNVATDVTSLAMGNAGAVVYATAQGVFSIRAR